MAAIDTFAAERLGGMREVPPRCTREVLLRRQRDLQGLELCAMLKAEAASAVEKAAQRAGNTDAKRQARAERRMLEMVLDTASLEQVRPRTRARARARAPACTYMPTYSHLSVPFSSAHACRACRRTPAWAPPCLPTWPTPPPRAARSASTGATSK